MIKNILSITNNYIKLRRHKINWRKKNKHNFTTVINFFPIEKVSIGKGTYGSLQVKTYGNSSEKLIIGSYCSIGGDVKFLLGGEHLYKGLSTYPFKKYVCGIKEDTFAKGPIVLKDDVWVGEGCLILSGVTIGQGSIIAAGSVVVKDVPPYGIYANGKIIKYRFEQEIISKLLNLNFANLNEEIIKDNIESLYKEINIEMLDNDFLNKLFFRVE